MTTQHTPGPWTIDRGDSRSYAAICAANWHGLAKVVVRFSGDNSDDETGIANTRLIAAAPDLLEACERLLGFAHHYGSESAVAAAHGLFEAARAAISKAKGQ